MVIEKALNVTGIFKADWDADTKIITVTYDAVKISNDELQRKIAAVGHDTEKYSAEDEVYKKLPGCCKYERKGKSSGSHAEHKH
jgi:periplasmic mercuric ion binding protein